MEIRWLDDFIVLAKTRNFSRAADERNVAQPTLSRRIKLLEDEMRVTLIDRNSLPLSLTPAGSVFLSAAEQISRIHRETKSRCIDIIEQEKSRLTFAATQTLYLGFWKSWLLPFAEQEDIEIDHNLKSTSWMGADFVNAISSGECDLVLCYWHPSIEFFQALDDDRFEHLLLCEEQLVPVTAVDDEGLPLHQLPGSKRQPVPYIGYRSSSFMQPVIQHFLTHHQDPPHLVTMNENGHSVSAKAMIKEGFGFGWIPSMLLQDNFKYKRLGLAGGKEWNISLQVRLYRLRHNPNSNLHHFWSQLKQQIEAQGIPQHLIEPENS
ncbi:MAG: LysR family transcriptional regulator [Amphritea sp.]